MLNQPTKYCGNVKCMSNYIGTCQGGTTAYHSCRYWVVLNPVDIPAPIIHRKVRKVINAILELNTVE